jgi:hypothetical protein
MKNTGFNYKQISCPFGHNPSILHYGPQPLTAMSTRNLPGGKGRQARKADNLTAICEPTVRKSRHLTTLWTSTACYRDTSSFYLQYENQWPIRLFSLATSNSHWFNTYAVFVKIQSTITFESQWCGKQNGTRSVWHKCQWFRSLYK